MSSRATLKIVMFVMASVLSAVHFWKMENGEARNPSSIEKWSELKPITQTIIHTSKLTLPASAELSIDEKVEPGAEFDLKVKVTRQNAADNYSYQLRLGKGLKLVSGHISGTLHWAPDQLEQLVSFRVQQLSDKNERIGFVLTSLSSGNRQRFSISSLKHFEEIAQQEALLERQREYLMESVEESRGKRSYRHNH